MASITFTGNVAADPELRFTPTGRAVVRFTVMENKRQQSAAGEWKDGEPNVFRCEAWQDLAEHIAESCGSGSRVSVTGRVVTDRWVDKDTQQDRTAQKIVAEEVGVSLRYHTAKAAKATRAKTEEAGTEYGS